MPRARDPGLAATVCASTDAESEDGRDDLSPLRLLLIAGHHLFVVEHHSQSGHRGSQRYSGAAMKRRNLSPSAVLREARTPWGVIIE